jgi:purine-binding chemotaxis protein CheW
VVPVVDLRLQFGLATSEPTVDTCIIIIEVEIDGAATVLGVLADSVQEVIDLHKEHMEPAPTMGTRINTDFIQAMGKLEDSFIIILDMDKVFANEKLEVSSDDAECAAA